MIANAHRLTMILVMIVFLMVCYVFVVNRSNHSAFSLYWVYVLVLHVALHSLFQLKASKHWLIPLAFGLVIIASVAVLDYLNIMLQYDTWLQRGMPERPGWSSL